LGCGGGEGELCALCLGPAPRGRGVGGGVAWHRRPAPWPRSRWPAISPRPRPTTHRQHPEPGRQSCLGVSPLPLYILGDGNGPCDRWAAPGPWTEHGGWETEDSRLVSCREVGRGPADPRPPGWEAQTPSELNGGSPHPVGTRLPRGDVSHRRLGGIHFASDEFGSQFQVDFMQCRLFALPGSCPLHICTLTSIYIPPGSHPAEVVM